MFCTRISANRKVYCFMKRSISNLIRKKLKADKRETRIIEGQGIPSLMLIFLLTLFAYGIMGNDVILAKLRA